MLVPIFQGNGGVAIVPSDTVQAGGPFRALYVGGAGHVTLVGLDGNVALFSTVPAGTVLEVGFVRVNATGTGATLMTGIT